MDLFAENSNLLTNFSRIELDFKVENFALGQRHVAMLDHLGVAYI